MEVTTGLAPVKSRTMSFSFPNSESGTVRMFLPRILLKKKLEDFCSIMSLFPGRERELQAKQDPA
jgi:hypothetical protein